MPYIGNPIYQSAFVTDQFSGDGTTTAFTMSVAPAGVTNVLVAVSGVLQDPSTYGVVGNTLTFTAAPPSGTGNISCRYLGVPASGITTTAYRTVTEFTATASQTTFTPPSYNVGFINVYLNGVLLGSADYTATNGTTVVLAVGASAGNLVTVESFLISSVANAIPNAAGSVGTTNIADNAITTAKIAAGAVVPADLSTGGPSWDTSGNLTVSGQASLGTGQTDYVAALGGGGTARVEAIGGNTNINLALSTKGTGAVYFWSGGYGGTNTMLIDGSGRVTTPNQPAFTAYKNTGTTYSATNTVVPLGDARVNIGSNFNTSTSRFTAPIAGRYFISAAGYGQTNPSVWEIRKNGVRIQYIFLGLSDGGPVWMTHGASMVVSMNVSDYIELFLTTGSVGDANDSTFLSGYLLG